MSGLRSRLVSLRRHHASLRRAGKAVGQLTKASIALSRPPVFSPAFDVTQLDAERHGAERASEFFVRILAIGSHQPYSIPAPSTCLGLCTEEFDLISAADGTVVEGVHANATPGGIGEVSLFDSGNLSSVEDRADGVALLAEALNSRNAFGQYTQLIRLFERAFKLGPGAVTEPGSTVTIVMLGGS